jgi:hypothetical protein
MYRQYVKTVIRPISDGQNDVYDMAAWPTNPMGVIIMEKPTIPNDVADAIESFRKSGLGNARIIYYVTNDDYDADRVLAARSIPFDTLLAALVNGYEREQTAEQLRQKAHDIIQTIYRVSIIEREIDYADGIKFAVDTLGIEISGVNV